MTATEPAMYLSDATVNYHWLTWKREHASVKLWVMAQQIGVTPNFLGRIERGQKPCPERIKRAYDQL